MGRDEALLPFQGGTLGQHVAQVVAQAAGSAVVIGDPGRYESFRYPVIADRFPGEGPLGGILTALGHTAMDWNLILACDMPAVSTEFLKRFFAEAEATDADVLVPVGPSGRPEPLCSVYHHRALPMLEGAFTSGIRRVNLALTQIRTARLTIADVAPFHSLNTLEEWASYAAQ
jgi:molybdopterin-guanine dinucleotide biosynthesis protein A